MRALGALVVVSPLRFGSLSIGVVVLGSLVTGSTLGCGPSLRRIHLADAYFERCYAGDRDERATDPERRACWRAWLASWRDDQPVERISFAEERAFGLDPERAAILAVTLTGDVEPDDPNAGVEGAEPADLTSVDGVFVEPTPTVAAEPTPEEAARAIERHRRHRPVVPRSATASCAAVCEPAWVECVETCGEAERACVSACRRSLRTCSAGCY